jgi:hypothetical protein
MASALLAEPAEGVAQRDPLLVRGLFSALGAYLSLAPISARLAALERFWACPAAPACPQLYLYSETDALVPPEAVRRFMGEQSRRGAAVTSRCWPSSGHVEHLRWGGGAARRLVQPPPDLAGMGLGWGWGLGRGEGTAGLEGGKGAGMG